MSFEKEFNDDRSGWWVDFIEGETERLQTQMLKLLLQRSAVDSLIVDNLRLLRDKLKAAGEVEIPTHEQYYQELQAKVMNQVVSIPPSLDPCSSQERDKIEQTF